MKKCILLATIALITLLPQKTLGWSATAHRVIAQIAQENVKSSTQKKINKLLEGVPMAYWSTWADFIKSDNTGKWDHTHAWHYVNAPANMSRSAFRDLLKSLEYDNLYKEIVNLEQVLANKQSTQEEKRIALIFLIHLVGDAHQPMHMGRPEDLGGNKIPVYWFNNKTNLHSLWDGKIVDSQGFSYTEYANILNVATKDTKRKMQEGELIDWLYDVHSIANEIYSTVNAEDKLSYEYVYKYKTLVETQMQKGGFRLAVILDRALR